MKDEKTMTSLVTTGGTGLISREDLAKSLNNAAMSMPSVGGDRQYLKMLTKGRDAGTWVFGQQETELEPDSLWAINPQSIRHGYVAWDTHAGGAPIHELMVPINRALPSKDTLPELPPGTPSKKAPNVPVTLEYADQRAFDAVCVSGDDTGTIVEYKQSSVGAMKLFGKVINALLDQIQKGDEIVPVGKFGFTTYDHKTYGEITNPEFEIVEWRSVDDTSPVEAEVPKEEPKPAPRTRGAAPAAAAAKEAPAADEPDAEDDDLTRAYNAEELKQAAEAEATPRRRQRR